MYKPTQLPPTLSVKDPDTRQFLDSLVNVLDLRSGNTDKSSPDRFITASDFQAAVDGISLGLSGGGATPASGVSDSVSSAVSGLAASIQSSLLAQILSSPVQLIDIEPIRQKIDAALQSANAAIIYESEVRQTNEMATVSTLNAIAARIGSSEAAIVNEQTVRVNKDNALASAINTMWSAIGGSQAVIQDGQLASVSPSAVAATKYEQVQAAVKDEQGNIIQSAVVRQDMQTYIGKTDGLLKSTWSVRVDGVVGGRQVIGGVGLTLSNTGAGAGPTVDFGVSADKFWVGSANGVGAIPFTVLTTPTIVNGVTRPAGTYIQDAFIASAAIDTLKIKGNAVTIPSTYNILSSGIILTRPPSVGQEFLSWQEVGRLQVTFDEAPSMVAVFGSINLLTTDQGIYNGAGLYCRIRESVSGAVTPAIGIFTDSSTNMNVSGGMSGLGAGAKIFILEVTRSYDGWGFRMGDGNITVFGAKR